MGGNLNGALLHLMPRRYALISGDWIYHDQDGNGSLDFKIKRNKRGIGQLLVDRSPSGEVLAEKDAKIRSQYSERYQQYLSFLKVKRPEPTWTVVGGEVGPEGKIRRYQIEWGESTFSIDGKPLSARLLVTDKEDVELWDTNDFSELILTPVAGAPASIFFGFEAGIYAAITSATD